MNPQRKAHLIAAIKADARLDGRKADEFRKIKIELDVSSTAEGSARVIVGETHVIAGVKMGFGKPYPDTPDDGVLMVNAELLPLSNPAFESGPPSIDSIETARVIDRGLRESHALDTKSLCVTKGESVWMVNVDVISINFDGNLIDVGGLAALAALKTARFPTVTDGVADYHNRTEKHMALAKMPFPITVYKTDDTLFVDPTQEEEQIADGRLTVTMTEDGKLCALQKGGDAPFTFDEVKKMIGLAWEKNQELRKLLTEVLS